MQKPYEKAWGATQSIIEPSAKGKKKLSRFYEIINWPSTVQGRSL